MAGWKDPEKVPPHPSFIAGRPDLPGPPRNPPSFDTPVPPPSIAGDPDYVIDEGP